MSEIEKYKDEVVGSIDLQRKSTVERIVKESDRLVDELLMIIYNNELDEERRPIVDSRTKLQAIGMLLDRGVPKLGVDHGKSETIEETGTRKKLRAEIEELVKKEMGKSA